jgi:uncharacterized protein with FMN-binding domain
MSNRLIALVSTIALASPAAGTAATLLSGAKKKVVTKKFAGQTAQAGQWGDVTVNVTIRITTIAGLKQAARRYIDLGGSYNYHTDRSQYIMSVALPLLRQEFLAAQTTNIQMISGATYTSQAFEQSLQSALIKART